MPLTAFISFSDNDPFSRLLCQRVAGILGEHGFLVDRYTNERREREWANYGATVVEASLQAAQWADVVICIVIPTYCGWVIPPGKKSICRMEYEAGQRAGRHAVAVVVHSEFRENLFRATEATRADVPDKRDVMLAFLQSENRWLAMAPERKAIEQPCLDDFFRYAKDQSSTLVFPDVETLERLLRKSLRDWMKSREGLQRLPPTPEPMASRVPFIEQLAQRMGRPGVIAVTGSWGVGATTAAIQAARRATTTHTPRLVAFLACRDRRTEEIRNELCHQAEIRIDQMACLGIHRNLIVLDHPSEQLCDPLPAEKATWVIVTCQRRLLRQLGIRPEDQFEVPGLSAEDARVFLEERLVQESASEATALEDLVGLLPQWPLALDAIANAIQDDMSRTPIADCVRQLQSGDYAPIIRRLLQRLSSSDLVELARLAAIPSSEFSTSIAAATLGMSQTEATAVLNRLATQSTASSTGTQRWRLEEVFRSVLNASADWNSERDAARCRLTQYFLDQLGSESRGSDVVDVLEADSAMVLELVSPQLREWLPNSPRAMRRLIQLADQVRSWPALERLCEQASAIDDPSVLPGDRAFFLWTAGKAAARRQGLSRATELFQQALKHLHGIRSSLHAKVLASHGSNLANQRQHEAAIGVFQKVMTLERNGRSGAHRPYINQHALAKSFFFLNRRSEANEMLQQSLEAAEARADHEHLANVWLTKTRFLSDDATPQEMLACFDRAGHEAEKMRGRSKRLFQSCLVLERRGDYLLLHNDYAGAKEALEKASQLVRRLNEPGLDLRIHSSLLVVYQQLGFGPGDSADVRDYLRREGEISRRLRLLLPMLRQARDADQDASAESLFNELRGIDVDKLSPYQASLVLLHLGETQSRRGHHGEAIATLKRAIESSWTANNQRGVTIGVLQLAKALRACQRFEEAIEQLESRLQRAAFDPIGQARLQSLMGQLFIDVRDYDRANAALKESLRIERSLGEAVGRSQAYPLHELALVCIKRHRFPEAIELLKEALHLENRFQNPRGQMIVLHSLARAELGLGKFHDAMTHIEDSLRIVKSSNRPYHQCQLLRTQATILRMQGLTEESFQKLADSIALADQSQLSRLVRHRILVRCELSDWLSPGPLRNRTKKVSGTLEEAGIQTELRPTESLGHVFQRPDNEGLRLLHEALRIAREHRELELELVVLGRIARRQTVEEATATLRGAVSHGLKELASLRSDRALRPVVKQLIAALRQGGKEMELEPLLVQLHDAIRGRQGDHKHLLRLSRLRQMVVCELGKLRSRQDRMHGVSSSLDFYRRECESAILDEDYYSLRSILLSWCAILANRGEVELAAKTLDEYGSRVMGKVPPGLLDRILLERAGWLATRSRRRRAVSDSEDWKTARRACLKAIRWIRRTSPKRSSHRPRMLLASILVDVGRFQSARKLLGNWFEAASRNDKQSPLDAESLDRGDQRISTLHTISIWSRIDHREAITLLDRLLLAPMPLNVRWDVVDVACLKARLLGDQRPYSADLTLRTAYDRASKEQNPLAQARLSHERGRLLQRLQQHEQAKEEWIRAVKHRKSLGDPLKTCDAQRVLSLHLRYHMDQVEPALEVARQAMEELNHVNDRRRVITFNSLVKLHRELGQLEEARRLASQAIAEAERWGDPRLVGSSYLTLAAVYVDLDESEKALDAFRRVIALLEHDPACNAFRYALRSRGLLHYRLRRIHEAYQDYRRFLDLSESLPISDVEVFEVRCGLAKSLRQLGFPQAALNQVDRALDDLGGKSGWNRRECPSGINADDHQRLRQALRLERGMILLAVNQDLRAFTELEVLVQEHKQAETSATGTESRPLVVLARVQAKALAGEGRNAQAIALWNDSRPDLAEDHRNLAIWELDGAIVRERLGQCDEALVHIKLAEQHAHLIRDHGLRVTTLASIQRRAAFIEMLQDKPERAVQRARHALDLAFSVGSTLLKWKAAETLARAQLSLEQNDDALQTIEQARSWVQANPLIGDSDQGPSMEDAAWLRLAVQVNLALGREALAAEWRLALEASVQQMAAFECALHPERIVSDGGLSFASSGSQPAQVALRPSDAERVSGTVTLIRDGSPPGIVVKLQDGREGFCSSDDALAGQRGNWRIRYKVQQQADFRVLAESAPLAGEIARVPLAPWNPPVVEWSRLHGKTVTARLLAKPGDPNQEYVLAETDTGEHIPIAFPSEFGWTDPGIGLAIDHASNVEMPIETGEDVHVFVSVMRREDSPPQLSGSLKTAYEKVLLSLVTSGEPVSGTILQVSPEAISVRLAPGVVGVCGLAQAVTDYDQAGHLHRGDRIAVVVRQVRPDVVRLDRAEALRTLIKQPARRKLIGRVIFSDRKRGTLLQFGPGLVGLGKTPTRPFAAQAEIVVEVRDRMNGRGSIEWHTIRTGERKGVRLEEGLRTLLSVQREFVKPSPRLEADSEIVVDRETDPIPDSFRGKDLQDFQKEAMRAIVHRDNIILCAPTGAGKTLVADWAIERSLYQGRRAIFASPVKALSNQKYRDFRQFERYPGQIGLVTGDVKLNPLAPVLVVTTETFRNWVIERPDSLRYFDLAIFDEVHYLDDDNRGSAWEESIMYAPQGIQIIALSATIPNVKLLSQWMNIVRDRSSSVIPARPIARPVPLVHRFCGVSRQFQVFGAASAIPRSYLQPEDQKRIRAFKYPEEVDLGREIVPYLRDYDQLPAIYFCAERDLCETYAEDLANRVSLHEASKAEAAEESFDRCLLEYGYPQNDASDKLRRLVGRGTGFHHSGLLPALKMTIEEVFEKGHIRLLYATDTFAIGVNMPARSVVFDTLNRGHGKKAMQLSGRQYAQMAGRAGRLGNDLIQKDPQGTVFSLIGRKQVTASQLARYEEGRVEPIESHLAPSYRTMLTLFAQQKKSIDEFWERTLACAEGMEKTDDPRYLNLLARWTFLERIGYRHGQVASLEGQICSRLAMNNEVALTEAWSRGWLIHLDPIQVVALFGCLACEKKHLQPAHLETQVIPVAWRHRMHSRLKELRQFEHELGISEADQMAEPKFNVDGLFAQWATGHDLASVLTATQPLTSAGDFINWARMALQGLTSLVAALPAGDPCIPRLIEAHHLLDRDEVRWDSQMIT